MTEQPKNIRVGRRGLLGGALAGGAALVTGNALSAPRAQAAPAPVACRGPRLHTREQWRAVPPQDPAGVRVEPFRPALVVVHHMDYPNSTDYSLEHAFQLSRDCQYDHMHNNGWNDIGQQLTLSRGGFLMEGRYRSAEAVRCGEQVIGAQVANWNTVSIGIENEGTYTTELPPEAQWRALVETCAWLCRVYGLSPMTAIVGHRDLNQPGTPLATECPGNALYKRLPVLRQKVAHAMGLPVGDGSPNHVAEDLPAPHASGARDHGPAVGPLDPTR
ncbi:peptidoglycan recognition family protein [Streptomyces sp. UNOC14_S4]|uniref:peptidoglycan recognition protein family protein n=1 Tax=Streptomyces sp. UNOC14_S4 TaxID=2872340 RepID=UPI001E31CA56|nr:peptidoglycan recognition family protein [Streptomyces sp. UNOC14_S4]MCC3766911.1 peptidoglycan recognition protein family protein [Streptomyces sp. UNOC14_S4]